MPDPRGVEQAVVVFDVDGCGARAVRRLGDGDRQLAMCERHPLQQRVAAPERDAPVDDHLGVAAQLVRLHRPAHAIAS